MFSPIQSGEIENAELDFKKLPTLIDIQIVYACNNCGFIIKNGDSLKTRYLFVITGDSESYKEQAIMVAGFKKLYEQTKKEGGKFENYMIIKGSNVIFGTKSVIQKGMPQELNDLFSEGVVHTVDCSENKNYDQLIEVMKQHNKYYQDQKIQ